MSIRRREQKREYLDCIHAHPKVRKLYIVNEILSLIEWVLWMTVLAFFIIQLAGKEADKCADCDNNLGGGVCTGNSENGMVDTTGEQKCFEKKSKKKKEAPAKEAEVVPLEEIADDVEGF